MVENKTVEPSSSMILSEQWGTWETDIKAGKLVKIPRSVCGSYRASSNQPRDWGNYKQAKQTLKEAGDRLKGLAFFMNSKHVFLDFDHVSERTESEKNAIHSLIKELYSLIDPEFIYTEVSQSGDGYHVIVSCHDIPETHKTRLKGEEIGDVELYTKKRFCALTFSPILDLDDKEYRKDDRRIISISFKKLVKLLNVKSEVEQSKAKANNTPISSSQNTNQADYNILDTIRKAKNSDKFFRLYDTGSLADYGGDASRAVFGFLHILAFYTQDYYKIDQIFRSSALGHTSGWLDEDREARGSKWNRLGQDTIRQALNNTTEYYKPPAQRLTERRLGQFEAIEGGEKLGKPEDTIYIENNPNSEWCPYIALVKKHFGEIRKCIFSGDCIVVNPEGDNQELPLLSTAVENWLRGQVEQFNAKAAKDEKLKATQVLPALTTYELKQKGELLVDIPEWDGVDRIADMASCLNLKEKSLEGECDTSVGGSGVEGKKHE